MRAFIGFCLLIILFAGAFISAFVSPWGLLFLPVFFVGLVWGILTD